MESKEILSSLAIEGAKISSCGKMCSDCAFKSGTDANNDEFAVDGAVSALQSGSVFNCHTEDMQDASTPCAGFLYAKEYLLSGQHILKKRKK